MSPPEAPRSIQKPLKACGRNGRSSSRNQAPSEGNQKPSEAAISHLCVFEDRAEHAVVARVGAGRVELVGDDFIDVGRDGDVEG